jgi:hypothetical protein
MTTKQLERDALEQIRQIIADLGSGSYVGTALDGVLHFAEENIEWDAAFIAPVSGIRSLRNALELVLTERSRQTAKWGIQRHSPERWLTILGEEYGELCEAVNETVMGGDHPERGGNEAIVRETTHVAAVALQILENFLLEPWVDYGQK